jgi:DNA modification methylase
MLLQANSLKIPLRDKAVHCVITSPPYYGLRDYGIGGQLGLEPTLQEYIDNTVLWAREVWRVLRDDGTFWLNLGDSYAGSWGSYGNRPEEDNQPGIQREKNTEYWERKGYKENRGRPPSSFQQGNLKPKDFIIWHKPNPMPESVTDRPTKSHEYIFLLTKSKKYFYDADAVREGLQPSSKERSKYGWDGKMVFDENGKETYRNQPDPVDEMGERWSPPLGRNKRTVWAITTKPYPGAHFATFPPELPEICIKAGTSEKGVCPVCGAGWLRARRPTEEHAKRIKTYRTMNFDGKRIGKYIQDGLDKKGWPQRKLADHFPSITGGITGCVHNWATGKNIPTAEQYKIIKRVLELGDLWDELLENPATGELEGWLEQDMLNKGMKGAGAHIPTSAETTGWKPTCEHDEEPIPSIVLDPFAGSGTTVMVANALGRRGIGIDLSWDYLQLARKRTGAKALAEWEHGKKVESNLEGLPMFTLKES